MPHSVCERQAAVRRHMAPPANGVIYRASASSKPAGRGHFGLTCSTLLFEISYPKIAKAPRS